MMVRNLLPDDLDALLRLNEHWVHFLSPLSAERATALCNAAELRLVVEQQGTVVAFLLAFREGARYDSVNYQWFVQRYPRFLYIDRVAVAPDSLSLGAGSLLYRHVFDHAAATEVPIVTCEFDVQPLNQASERFHRRLGFDEVGRQKVANDTKWVSMQLASTQHVPA